MHSLPQSEDAYSCSIETKDMRSATIPRTTIWTNAHESNRSKVQLVCAIFWPRNNQGGTATLMVLINRSTKSLFLSYFCCNASNRQAKPYTPASTTYTKPSLSMRIRSVHYTDRNDASYMQMRRWPRRWEEKS